MIYVNDKKSAFCKGDFRPAQFYKGGKRIAGYEKVLFEKEGSFALENCYNDKIHNAKITGNCYQEETPSPENPVEIKCVGDRVTEGVHKGKYKIGIVASTVNMTEHFDIYLDAPLCKIGSYEDYIDFENKKVVRNTRIKTFTGREGWYRQEYRVYTQINNKTGLSSDEKLCVCNRFAAYSWTSLYNNTFLTNKKIGVAIQSGCYLNITPAQTVPTAEEWKAQLSAWNDEGEPLVIVSPDVTREEVLDLPSLPTFRGTTIYEIDTEIPAKISGEYKRME